MCDAVSVGMASEAVGTMLKASAEQAHGRAVKAADNLSADFAEQAAADAVASGNLKELQVAMRGDRVVAAQRVAQSGGGADVNVGGNRDVQEATEAISDVDRATVRRNAALEAYGLRTRARGFRQHGEDAETEGNNAALGTFLGGLASETSMGGKRLADAAQVPSATDRLLASAPPPFEGDS